MFFTECYPTGDHPQNKERLGTQSLIMVPEYDLSITYNRGRHRLCVYHQLTGVCTGLRHQLVGVDMHTWTFQRHTNTPKCSIHTSGADGHVRYNIISYFNYIKEGWWKYTFLTSLIILHKPDAIGTNYWLITRKLCNSSFGPMKQLSKHPTAIQIWSRYNLWWLPRKPNVLKKFWLKSLCKWDSSVEGPS